MEKLHLAVFHIYVSRFHSLNMIKVIKVILIGRINLNSLRVLYVLGQLNINCIFFVRIIFKRVNVFTLLVQ